MEDTRKEAWILILDIISSMSHTARPLDKQKGHYVTACGIDVWLVNSPRYHEIDYEFTEEGLPIDPTCDWCSRKAPPVYGNERMKKFFDDFREGRL